MNAKHMMICIFFLTSCYYMLLYYIFINKQRKKRYEYESYEKYDDFTTLEIKPEKFRYCLDTSFNEWFFENLEILPIDPWLSDCIQINDKSYMGADKKFALFANSWKILKLNLISNYKKCAVTIDTETCLSLKCGKKRQNFVFILLKEKIDYWYGQDCSNDASNNELAFLKFSLQKINVINNRTVLLYPKNMDTFNLHLENSRFVHCDYELAKKIKKNRSFKIDESKKFLTSENFQWFVNMRNVLLKLNLVPLLGSGTLLGWLRECAIIPYTNDFDFYIDSHTFDQKKFETTMMKHNHFRLYRRFGKLNDSLEYSILDPLYSKIDVFLLYQDVNSTWYGMIGLTKVKLIATLPKLSEVCSTDLLGHLFYVPCNFVDFVKTEYGPNWTVPFRDFAWYKSAANSRIVHNYSEEEYNSIYVKYTF